MELILLEETDSTNSHVNRMAESGLAPHGTVVCSLHQTDGRGQRGNSWLSPAGMGLYLSVYYVLDFVPADKQGLLAKSWALAAQRYVRSKMSGHHGLVQIKWPNDILLESRKVGGMLIENSVRGSFLSDCIIGVGINLNQVCFEDGLASPPVSLKMMTGDTYDVRNEALEFAAHLDWSLAAILSNAHKEINSGYADCLFGLNNEVQFDHSGEKVAAILRGVDDDGQAILESGEGCFRVSHPDYRLSLTHTPSV
ncbi:MAG: hypothetical protein RLZZ630_1552 [Bacteroidota bacterium]|jgi:BirA family biotin operon repressor/biotin-[acetyl-CoA-carboxylase] ligase